MSTTQPIAADAAQTILVVDDDDTLRTRLGRAFTDRGYRVFLAATVDSAIRTAIESAPDLVVVDLKMPGQSGLEFVDWLRKQTPKTKAVVLTGYGSIATATEAIRMGATSYLAKPADVDDILLAFSDDRKTQTTSDVNFRPPTLARAEWEHINRVLFDCDGNISRAARQLGIHRRSLQRKLNKYPPRT